MRELRGKTAVVTGGASGIGRAMGEAFAAEGMRLVLADIEAGALEEAAGALRAAGAAVLAVPTDVSDAEHVQALADRAVAEFGRVDVVCNNAGVALSGATWDHSLKDWEWLLGVNLWGVIHGIRTFVPLMLRQGGEGHVVNTGSVAGLTSNPFMSIYNASKHAVVTLSETLHKELQLMGTEVKVSVLCPGFVSTRILDAERNRPAGLQNPTPTERHPTFEEMARGAVAAGLPPREAAARVVDAVKQERFYVLTHPEFAPRVQERMDDILQGRNPTAALSLG
jgi:NAD(P)-dependent dehydrogenase (short-subunit alcohol dehydrogenase family)